MRIVQVAPLEEPVPPKKYGGTELVVYNLCEEMTRMGHEVYLLAAGDSRTSAKLVPIIPQSLRSGYSAKDIDVWRNFLKTYHISTVLSMIREINPDIVHNHYAWRLIQFQDFIECPMYTTVHGPITSIYEQFTYAHYPEANYISISNNQRLAMPKLNWIKTIYNGIDTHLYEVGQHSDRDAFLFLGRISPEKGVAEICEMIRQTTHRLIIAAKLDSVDRSYYEDRVRPLIDGKQISYVGEVGLKRKQALLKSAKALLLWLNWEEPFGLAVVEAMASGTPVIVNRRGSMPEIVVDGQTGFLVDSLAEMQDRLSKVHRLDPLVSRHRVERHFSATQMAKEYLTLAGKLTV